MAQAITKAQLQAALEQAQARISELEAAQAAAATPAEAPAPAAVAQPHLSQVLWLQRKPLAQTGPDGKGNVGYTAGGTLVVRFGAQYASIDRETGQRLFGPWKFFTAYGQMAAQVIAFMQGDDRLVRIQAYEEPWSSSSDPNSRQADWVVRGFTPIGRGAASPGAPRTRPAAAPVRRQPEAHLEPTLAEVAF